MDDTPRGVCVHFRDGSCREWRIATDWLAEPAPDRFVIYETVPRDKVLSLSGFVNRTLAEVPADAVRYVEYLSQ